MRCSKCGTDFRGNYCPVCGNKSSGSGIKEDGKKKTDRKTSEVTKEIAKDGVLEYWGWRFKFIFLGAFLAAVCAFAMGKIMSGVMLAVAGILLSPPILKKWIGRKRKILIGVAVLFIVLGLIATKGSDRGSQVIEYVKQYRPSELSESIGSIGEFMELGDLEVKWNYETKDGIEYVSAEYDEDGHHTEIIFKVDDYPELYDVLLDGESNNELYYGFDSRLFGNGDAVSLLAAGEAEEEDSMMEDISENSEDDKTETPALEENSSVDENDTSYLHIGDVVKLTSEAGEELSITFTDWGETKDSFGETAIYINYTLENIGETEAIFNPAVISAYADDYEITQTVGSESGIDTVSTLSAGRKADRTLYLSVNPSAVSVIEIECGGCIWRIKDDDTRINNENEEVAGNVTLSEDAKLWFLNYDSFYHVRVGDQLSISAMNDALLFVSFTGINGDYMEWEFSLEPDAVNPDGSLGYFGDDICMTYYPEDHHLDIDTNDSTDLYYGEYWPN